MPRSAIYQKVLCGILAHSLPPLAQALHDRKQHHAREIAALEAELAKTKTALDSAVLAARTLGEQHDASLKREASREDLSSDAVARSEQLERELVDAKMKLAQTAMELGELRMARSATPPPVAPRRSPPSPSPAALRPLPSPPPPGAPGGTGCSCRPPRSSGARPPPGNPVE